MTQTLPLFLRWARASKLDVDRILRRFALPPDAERLRELEVPLRVLQEAPEAIATDGGERCLGLAIARESPRGTYGVTEFSAASAPTLGEACRRWCAYGRLIDDLTNTAFVEREDEAVFSLRITGEAACYGRQVNELVMALLVRRLTDALSPYEWRPRRVWLAHPTPSDRATLQASLRTSEIELGAGFNGFAVRTADLALPIPRADPALREVLDEVARRTIDAKPRLPRSSPLDERLREEIRRSLRQDGPRLERVAAGLGLSVRTLQRRLTDERRVFKDVVEEVRMELARGYLGEGELVLGEIAYLIGYSDLRAFVRAFKAWTGMTPARYRARLHRVA